VTEEVVGDGRGLCESLGESEHAPRIQHEH
jgi:hypothetical protein